MTSKIHKPLVSAFLIPFFIASCGSESTGELQCSTFVILNKTDQWPILIEVSEYEDDQLFPLGVNLFDQYVYGTNQCEVGLFPTPEDVFDELNAYIQNDSGDVPIYSGVNNEDWVAELDVTNGVEVMRFSIAFDLNGVTLVQN